MIGGLPKGPGVNSASEGRSKRLGPPRNAVQKRSRFGIHRDVPFLSCQPQFESKGRSQDFSVPTLTTCSVDSSTRRLSRPYLPHSAGFLRTARSVWFEERLRGVQAQPTGLTSKPRFSLANSPVSPVDRKHLLTARSNSFPSLSPHPTFARGTGQAL